MSFDVSDCKFDATRMQFRIVHSILHSMHSILHWTDFLSFFDPSMEIEFGAKNWKESLYMEFVGPQILDFCYFLSLMAKFTFTIPWEVSW